ncbi:TIGR03746 family integrating conjugative element protein [Vibrio europaeus]|uniref:DUF2895 family protein n=1 Tax=Vibrio europaeus TaxID=300876 RepID=UPI00233F78B3|nr:DUF2895 family protein [Vibrio europaeus]MDC5870282.1 TIGR03746 family integrating conjugative element protein [Vibrio europaeus]
MGAKSASDKKDGVIRVLTFVCVIFAGLLLHAHTLVANTPEDLNCYIPPTLSGGGKLQKILPKHEAYAFAREVNQQIRRCETDCSKDFENNIHRFSNLYSPAYKADLLAEAQRNKSRNRNRVRFVSEYGEFDWDKVKTKEDGTTIVRLQVKEVEYVGTKKVRDAIMEYPFILRYADVDRQKNPWKLWIDGTDGQPIRLYSLEEEK